MPCATLDREPVAGQVVAGGRRRSRSDWLLVSNRGQTPFRFRGAQLDRPMPAAPIRAASAWTYSAFNIKVPAPPTGFQPTVTADAAWSKMFPDNGGLHRQAINGTRRGISDRRENDRPVAPQAGVRGRKHRLDRRRRRAKSSHRSIRAALLQPSPCSIQDDPSRGVRSRIMDATSNDTIVVLVRGTSNNRRDRPIFEDRHLEDALRSSPWAQSR